MQRELQIIGDRKLRDAVAEDMFNENKRRALNFGASGKMITDYNSNIDYWRDLADVALERIARCLT